MRKPMFGIYQAHLVEPSRPSYHRELDEYARLEYPLEDPRTVSLLALAAAKRRERRARPRFWLFRWFHAPSPRTAGKI
jgi:hypothetical protein